MLIWLKGSFYFQIEIICQNNGDSACNALMGFGSGIVELLALGFAQHLELVFVSWDRHRGKNWWASWRWIAGCQAAASLITFGLVGRLQDESERSDKRSRNWSWWSPTWASRCCICWRAVMRFQRSGANGISGCTWRTKLGAQSVYWLWRSSRREGDLL